MSENEKPTIILLHGTMGSVLRKNNKKVWPLIFSNEKMNSAENLTPISENDGIEPSKSLDTYTLFKIALNDEFNIIDRVYDWRKNNLEHLEILKQDIENAPSDKVVIVAHSMGGIIAKLLLNKYKEDEDLLNKVEKLITVGTPWKGSMNAIKFLIFGANVPEMKVLKFLDSQTSRKISPFFPSVYQLLPSQEYLDYLHDNSIPPIYFNGSYYQDIYEFFNEVLKNEFQRNHRYTEVFDEFYELLNQELPEQIDHHEIISTGVPTASVISEKSNKEPDTKWDDGDGTVTTFSSYSNSTRDNYKPYFVRKKKHNFLMSYPEVNTLVKDIINERIPEIETPQVFFSLESQYYHKFQGYIQKVACPVEVSIKNNDGLTVYGDIDAISEDEIRELLKSDYNVNTIGSTTYIIYDEEDDTEIDKYDEMVIEAYGTGSTSVSFDKYEEGSVKERNAFKSFTIDPERKAVINLNRNLEESSLKISKNGQEEETLQLEEIEFDDEKVQPPNTFIDVSGEFIIPQNNEVYFAKSSITLSVNSLEAGTFPTRGTYIIVNNGEEIPVEDNEITLDSQHLKNGKNIIEYYSDDEYDNNETKKNITIYFVKNSYDKIYIDFQDRHYTINIKENIYYDQMVIDLKKQKTEPKINFNQDDGVTGYDVVYRNLEREVNIHLEDIFGDIQSHNILINEKIVKSIIRGTASVQEVEKFVNNLNLENYEYKFNMNTGTSGYYRKLKQENLEKCIALFIYSDTFNIKFSKDVDHDVRFITVTEEVKLRSEDEYLFEFRVLDHGLDEYIPNLSLHSNFSFDIRDQTYEETFNINYNPDTQSYVFHLELIKAREFADSFWKNSINQLIEANIKIINTQTGITIRPFPFTLENR